MLPTLPIPEPMRGAEPESFAYRSVALRLPDIGRRTLAEGNFSPEAASRLQALIAEVPHRRISSLKDHGAPDEAAWQAYVQPYEGQTWLEAPWFFVETYFYRRVLQATGFFQPGFGYGVDPFAYQKSQGLLQARDALRPLELELLSMEPEYPVDLSRLLRLDLWGNQADLSMWPAGGEQATPSGGKDEHLLCDEVEAIVQRLRAHPGQVDIVLDNTGAELAFDLLLVNGLLCSGLAPSVRLWAKAHPTFVSDATQADVRQAVDDLLRHGSPGVQALAGRLLQCLEKGRLKIASHDYWTSPLAGWEMPDGLRKDLSKATLILSKGDANYRRWLGDRHWAHESPLEDVLAYVPVPLGLLRVLKSEVGAGMPAGCVAQAAARDVEWMTDGKWGVVQYLTGRQT